MLGIFNPGTIDLGSVGDLPAVQGVRQDSLVYPKELTQLMGNHRELYRPQLWRTILDVENVNEWAREIEDRKWTADIAEPVNVTNRAPTQELPMPNISTSNTYLKLFKFGLAYGVYDQDIAYASKLGINLGTEGLQAVNTRFETFLENLAAKGDTATGMKGLGNLADVSAVTKGTQASGTTWATATTAEIVADLHAICNAVELNSKQNAKCDTLVLSLTRSFYLDQKRSDSLERTPWEIFQSQRGGVQRLHWELIGDQGAGSTQPLFGFAKNWEYAPKMVMQHEVRYLPAMRGTLGYVVPAIISTAGVRCLAPQVVCKMSGI